MNPSHIAIQNPIFIFILVIVISVWGSIAYREIPREAAPDIQIPLLIVTIPFPGASPEDVESLITNKAEQELNLEGPFNFSGRDIELFEPIFHPPEKHSFFLK